MLHFMKKTPDADVVKIEKFKTTNTSLQGFQERKGSDQQEVKVTNQKV